MSISRRNFLKWAGAANLTLVASTTAESASNTNFKGYPDSQGVLFDSTLCIGCRECEKSCNEVNNLATPEKSFTDLTVLEEARRTSNESFTVVNRYDTGGSGSGKTFSKIQCNHCLEPACAAACFVNAFEKTPSGAVIYDESVCVGCRYCMIACPFEIPTYEYNDVLTPRVRKCTMCHPRVMEGLLPGCVESCPTEALVFGRRTDLLTIARERILNHKNRYIDHIYGEHEMGGTSWLYLSGNLFDQIGLNVTLGVKPAIEYTAGTLSAVPIIVGLWPVLLTGAYAMTKRRDKVSQVEREQAVKEAVQVANKEAEDKKQKALDKAEKANQRAIDSAVKQALTEAKKTNDEPTE